VTPYEYPDQWLRLILDQSHLLTPNEWLMRAAVEYFHRTGVRHDAMTRLARPTVHQDAPQGPQAFIGDDDLRTPRLIAVWRKLGATWTRRTPPHWLPKDSILWAPCPGTLWECEVGRYYLHRVTEREVVLRDVTRPTACLVPTWEKFHREWRPAGPTHHRWEMATAPVWR